MKNMVKNKFHSYKYYSLSLLREEILMDLDLDLWT
jgi:hypothetical protein